MMLHPLINAFEFEVEETMCFKLHHHVLCEERRRQREMEVRVENPILFKLINGVH